LCGVGFKIININDNYKTYLVLKDIVSDYMIKLNEKGFLIQKKNNIMKIKFNESKLYFDVLNSINFLLKKDYYMDLLIQINNNYNISKISKIMTKLGEVMIQP
jgi:hypothetical protein